MNALYRKQDLHRLHLGTKGFFRCIGLLSRNRNTHYVISTFGVGDALMACAYLKAYKEAYKIPHVTLIGKKSMRDIFRMYEGEYDDLLLMDDAQIVQLSDAFLFDISYHVFYKWKFRITPAVIICHVKNFDMLNRAGNWFYHTSTMQGLYKALLYMLPMDTQAVRPNMSLLPDISGFAAEYGAVPQKSVVLMPYAYSVQKLEDAFWEGLAGQLQEKGFVCYTNTFKPGEKPIADTKAVSFGLMETAAFIRYCGKMVALRSGMCDLVQYAACRMAVIYPGNDGCGTKHFYTLDGNNGVADIMEFTPEASWPEETVAKICSFITKE